MQTTTTNITQTFSFMEVVAKGQDAVGMTAVHPTEGKGKVTDVRQIGSLVIVSMDIKGNLVVDCGTEILVPVN